MNFFRALCVLGLLGMPVFAADPASKMPPPPAQGTVTPSGKFTSAYTLTATNENVPRTLAEAEAALKHALNLKQIGSNTFQLGRVEFDKEKRTVTLPARVCGRHQIVEYALVTDNGKTYESLLATPASPVDVHLAFLLLNVNQTAVSGDARQPAPVPDTNALRIEVSWQTNGLTATVPLADLISLTDGHLEKPGRPMKLEKWLYNGSVFDSAGFAAAREGSLVALIRDPAALVNNPGGDRDNDLSHLPDTKVLPGLGAPVRVVFRLPEPAVTPPVPLPGVTPVTPLSTNRF